MITRYATDREVRRAERDIGRIPTVKNRDRRRRCLADVYKFLAVYFPFVFYQRFTTDRVEMLQAIIHCARYVGDQGIAAPRGDGKTRSALFAALWLALRGEQPFPLILSKSGPRAKQELKNLKDAMTRSDLFALDFPEVMYPIIALEGATQRGKLQTYADEFTQLDWREELIILPTISTELLISNRWNKTLESTATGQIIASLGIEGPIRGLSIRNQRPTMAIIDDIDDRESAASDHQTGIRRQIIDEDVGGLGGPGRTVSRVYLGTLLNHKCCAAIFTDVDRKPSFKGRRHRWVDEWPDRGDLWDTYLELLDDRADDDDGRVAHAFYLENRADMDQGAKVTNPERFDDRQLKDGSAAEVSSIQAAFNLIHRIGREAFEIEYQNNPPEESKPVESGITAALIMDKTSGYERLIVPPDCEVITVGADVKKVAIHWVARAWRSDATGFTIDYGVEPVLGTTVGSDDGVELAIMRAIRSLYESMVANPYEDTGGQARAIDAVCIDTRWQGTAVSKACAEMNNVGLATWYPSMGHGKSAGCARVNFTPVTERTAKRRPGIDRWYGEIDRRHGVWVIHADADHFKAFEHSRWLTKQGRPGSMTIYDTPDGGRSRRRVRAHMNYAKHVTAEIEVEDSVKGIFVRKWVPQPGQKQNHYLDASYWSCVAASTCGISLLGGGSSTKKTQPKTLAQMKAEAR